MVFIVIIIIIIIILLFLFIIIAAVILNRGTRCNSVVEHLSNRSLMVDPGISRSNQCSTTGVTKAIVCAILYVGWCI